jgi:hypothetical protein
MSPELHIPNSVVPIHGANETVVGTGAIIGSQFVLTALHVIDPEPARLLYVGRSTPVVATTSLPVRCYGTERHLARISYQRDLILTGDDLGTVDLALLAVPGLNGRPLPLRRSAVKDGERIEVPGYPEGRPGNTAGRITSHDNANFVAELTLRTGNSGSPAIDRAGRIAGLATLDHDSAGAIFIGPALLTTFTSRAIPLLARALPKAT